MNSTNNISARLGYENAIKVLYDAWIDQFGGDGGIFGGGAGGAACLNWVNNRKLSQGEVRIEVTLTTTNNNFIFGVTPNQASTSNKQFPTETRLNLQDSLIVAEYGLFIGLPANDADANWELKTYGNSVLFTGPSAAALNAGLYSNGGFQVKVNNDVVIPYRGLFNHWYRPQTQQTAALGAGSPQDQVRGAEDGFVTDEPNILLIGSKSYVPQIVLPANLASVDAGTRAVLVFRGINAQNSTVIN